MKIAGIILVIFLPLSLFGQKDSTKVERDSSRIMYSWKLSDDYLSKEATGVDTILDYFHQYNPLYKWSFGNSFLGNTGSPVLSQLYFTRYDKNEFYFLNYYYPYLETVDKTNFYNTRRQFTQLTYINGGSNSEKEENLGVFHTQNVSPNINFGFKFYTVASEGQYLAQKTRRNSLKFFASYEGKILKSYFNFNNNNFVTSENGGVIVDSVYYNPDTEPEEVTTRFGDENPNEGDADVKNTFRNLSFELVNDINLLSLFSLSSTDTTNTKRLKTKLGILYITGYERDKKMFTDPNPLTSINYNFYDTVFFNTQDTYDSTTFNRYYNSLRSYFIPFKNTYAFAGLTYEWQKYSFHSRDISDNLSKFPSQSKDNIPFFYKDAFTNVIFNSGLKISVLNLAWDIRADYFLTGYKQGDFDLFGALAYTPASGKYKISPSLDFSFERPLYLYNNYYSNGFIWRNNFTPVKKAHLSLFFRHSPKKFETKLDFALLRNVIYFDTNAYPKQYDEDIQVLSGSVSKEFRFWKISSLNKIALQNVNKTSIISLPVFVFYNSTFFQQRIFFKFTGGEFITQLGFDMVYNTKYFVPSYMPHTASFYNQQELQFGNYPYVDIFLNIKLKRARFFFKFEHVNSGLLDKDYFTVLNYPRSVRMFRFGISWNFYD